MGKIQENLPQRIKQTRDKCRDRIELMRSRINLLKGEEKLLMTMYLDKGNSVSQLARLAGVNDANIARRINSINKRLVDGEYIVCLRNCDKFTAAEMSLAKEYFLHGFSMREIAEMRFWTYYKTRKAIRKIRRQILDIAK